LLFVVMVLWQPEGIAGLWQAAARRRNVAARAAAARSLNPSGSAPAQGVPAIGNEALHGPL
jgi:hypothetical protein